jgi:fructoselysine 3-epimerase
VFGGERLKNVNLAGMNLHYLNYSLEYFLDSMVKYEMPNIELWGGFPHLYSEDISLSDAARIRKEIESRCLNLVCYTPEQLMYVNNIAAKEPEIQKRSMDYYLKNIEITAELGTNLMLMTSGWGYYHEPIVEAWSRSREALAILAHKAEKSGVTLLLEPLQPFESNLITNVQTLKRMLQEINMDSLKGMMDIVAMAVAGDTVKDYFEALGAGLLHIHVIDGTPSGHLAVGDGNLPIDQYLKEIDDFQYHGYLSMELAASNYYPEPDKAFLRSLENIRKMLY